MKRFFVLILVILSVVACSKEDVTFTDNQGKEVHTVAMEGKWVVVNYWATWCHSCAEEVGQINAFYKANRNKNVLVLGVNYDGLDEKSLKLAVNKLNIKYPVLLTNPAKALGLKDPGVLPVTFVINPKGEVVKQLLGPQTQASLEKAIKGR